MGRAEMRLTSPKNIRCPVPQYAHYSPWNHERNEADNLLYRTVTKVTLVTMLEDLNLSARRESDLWLQLPAENGQRAWVTYSDAKAQAGTGSPGIYSYGVAEDFPDPSKLSLKGVTFESGSAELTEASKKLLDVVAGQLNYMELLGHEINEYKLRFEISGHTDSRGSRETNLKLSQQRADAAVEHLNSRGVQKYMLKATGYGEAHPIADNNFAEGREANRRLDIQGNRPKPAVAHII